MSSTSGTEMIRLEASGAPATHDSLQPEIDALVERRVQAFIADSDQQVAAQVEAWNRSERELLQREELMQQAMAELNAKLMDTEKRLADQIAVNTQDALMGESASLPPVNVAATPRVTKKHKVDSRRHHLPKIVIPGGRALRSSTSRATMAAERKKTGAPVDDMDTLEDYSEVPLEGSTAAAQVLSQVVPLVGTTAVSQVPTGIPPTPAKPPPNTRSLAKRTNTQSQPQEKEETQKDKEKDKEREREREKEKERKKKKKAVVVKAAAEVFRYLPREMPADMGGLAKAMSLHLRILWSLLDAKAIPLNPPSELLADFHRRFSDSNENHLFVIQAAGPELIPRHLIQVGTSMSSSTGRIAEQARSVEQHMLSYIQLCLSRFGLRCWCPDLRQSAYSLYNAACRIIALDTFKQALVSHAYLALAPNTIYASNTDVLVKLYDHFVYHYMRLRYRREGRVPGSVALQLQASPQYQGRIRLAASRLKFLEENNYPRRYRALVDPKATSDDEYDPKQKAWIVKRRPERSMKANQWVRMLDRVRRETVEQHPTRKWRERRRIVPSDPSQQDDSPFVSTPDNMPIDYFEPDFFNKLQPKTRNRVATKQVAFLEDINRSFTWCPEERMSDKAFFKKYGKERLRLYDMVGDEEFDDADDEWYDDTQAEDDVADMEYSDAPTVRDNASSVGSARASFSAGVSASESASSSISGNSSMSGTSDSFTSGRSNISEP